MAYDPFENAREEVGRRQGRFSLALGRVSYAPDNSEHIVIVEPLSDAGPSGESGPVPAEVGTTSLGDIAVPTQGDLVIFGRFNNGRIIVLQSIYSSDDEVRDYTSDQRHIGRDEEELILHGSSITLDATAADDVTVDVGDTSITVSDGSITIDTTGDVNVSADTIVSNGGGKIVAAEGDTITGDGHDHGGEVSSDTVTGSIDSKGSGDIEVNN